MLVCLHGVACSPSCIVVVQSGLFVSHMQPVSLQEVNCYIMLNKAFYVPCEYSKYLFGKPKQISVLTD